MTARPAPFLRKLWLLMALAGLLLCVNATGRADVPAVFNKTAPESVDDLKAIQAHLQKMLEKVKPSTVGIMVGNSAGSGVIVSADGLIMTAGHVSGKADLECTLILHDGRLVKGKTLGLNRGNDSGMIKITDEGKYPFVEMGDSAKLAKGTWCFCVGHPGGYVKGREPVVRLGRVLDLKDPIWGMLRTDCTLVGGDSGGPLFDMEGKVIGIHSRIQDRITDNYHVPVNTYKDTWDKLVKFGSPFVGLRFDIDAKEECKVTQVQEGSPAEKAGFKAGDVVVKFGEKKPTGPTELLEWIRGKAPGDEVTMEVQREKEKLNLKLTVGRK